MIVIPPAEYERTRIYTWIIFRNRQLNVPYPKGYVLSQGTGNRQTTIIKTLIQIFESKGLSTVLAAPTGRAAKRVSETSGYEAKTIHRLREVGYSIEDNEKPYFMRNEDNPLLADVMIIDEASMIDIVMMEALLRAFPWEASLILVGDSDQLPSVGPGKVLSDIIESGSFPVVKAGDHIPADRRK